MAVDCGSIMQERDLEVMFFVLCFLKIEIAIPMKDKADAAGAAAKQARRVAYALSMHRCNGPAPALRPAKMVSLLFDIACFTGM